MKESAKTIEIKVKRTILAPLDEVFDGWINPKIPGNPWNAAEKFVLDPKVDGLFYWLLKGTAHYRRFTRVERPGRIQHTCGPVIWSGRNFLVGFSLKLDVSGLSGRRVIVVRGLRI